MGARIQFDPVECGVILRKSVEMDLDQEVWEPFGLDKGFHEDKFPVKIDGVIYPPTFNWKSQITAHRRKDKEFFYVNITIRKADLKPDPNDDDEQTIDIDQFIHDIDAALALMKSFGDCECKVGQSCALHQMVTMSSIGLCVGCGKLTNYRCPFCLVMDRTSIAVCEQPECRAKHESNGCARFPHAVSVNA